MSAHGPMPRSAWIFPALAVLLFVAATGLGVSFTPSPGGLVFAAVLLIILFGTVFAAVHHAEVIAERIGEPYGTLLLTLAVTIIEVALIATIMLGEKPCRRWRATSPVLLDRFLNDAIEVDVDALVDDSDGGKAVVIGGIMEHVEQAGVPLG